MFTFPMCQFSNSGYITSIQEVSITIGSGATSNTATITAVSTPTTLLIYQGLTTSVPSGSSATAAPLVLTRLSLTNSTTVTASRDTSTTDSVVVKCMVVEFTSAAVSGIQYGTVSLSTATSGTASISSVDTSNSAIFLLGATVNTSTSVVVGQCRVALTNSTTVTANTQNANAATVGFAVVQFNGAVINSIQQRAVTLTSSSTSDTDTITSVTTANCLLAYGGTSTSNTTFSNGAYSYTLNNSTTVTLTRQGTSGSTRTINYTVIEFKTGILKSSVQRGTISLQSATSNTATITSVDTSKAICNFLGFNMTLATPATASSMQAITQTNATTITGTVNASDANPKAIGYEVVEFN